MSDLCKICGDSVPYNNKKKGRVSGRLSKWDIIAAGELGWFFQRNGDCFCPKHVPEWVPAWRERQKRKAKGNSS